MDAFAENQPSTNSSLRPSEIAASLLPVVMSAEVHIGGVLITPLFSITIDSAHADHDCLTIHLPLSATGEDPASLVPGQAQALTGKVADVVIANAANPAAPRLEGRFIITAVSFEHTLGAEATVVLTGHSPTRALDGAPHFESFLNRGLKDIAATVATTTLQQFGATLKAAPTFGEPLGYSACFGESSWNYLKRLAAQTGQWLYYNSRELVFGVPHSKDEPVALSYGGNCHRLILRSATAPVQAGLFAYHPGGDRVLTSDAKSGAGGAGSFAEGALRRSAALYGSHPAWGVAGSLPAEKGVLDAVAGARSASVATGLYRLSGSSRLFELKVGVAVRVSMGRVREGEEQHSDMRVVAVRHHLDCGGGMYENSFEAVSASAAAPPVIDYDRPQTGPVSGRVTDNKDPAGLGRVKVRLTGWVQDHSEQETDWIRVLCGDAGGSPQNRGIVFVPEVGDGVVVDFEYGNPDSPFVAGSFFHGGNAAGQSSMIRSITTKTGHTIELDDNGDGTSITIKDKSGNEIYLDTKGGYITITAPESMTLNANDIHIVARRNVSISAGMNLSELVGVNKITSAGMNISQSAGADFSLLAKNIMEKADDKLTRMAKTIEKTADKIDVSTTKDDLTLNSSKKIVNKSGDKTQMH